MPRRTMREGPDLSDQAAAEPDVEVMGAYDDIDGVPAFIIAALDSEDAWLAVPEAAALDVSEWC